MSRMIIAAFFVVDASTVLASSFASTNVVSLLVTTMLSSILFAMMSCLVRSVLCPVYFWDEPATEV